MRQQFYLSAFVFYGLGICGSPTQAQDLYQDLAIGAATQGLSQAEIILKQLPAMIEGGLAVAQSGHEFESAEFCRGNVQAIVNMGAVLSNMMPFTKVWTYEDERGPVGKLRIMLNGQQIHTEVYCNDTTLWSSELPWGEGVSTPEEVDLTTLSAMLGAGLNLQLQGLFDKSELSQAGVADRLDFDPNFLLPPQPDTSDDHVADALENAVAALGAGSGPNTPPMTGAEREAFLMSVNRCWIINPSPVAARVTVDVAFNLDREGRVIGDMRLVSADGDKSEADTAFEAARRAILRCQSSGGYQLPADKYDQWAEVIVSFDPNGLRLR